MRPLNTLLFIFDLDTFEHVKCKFLLEFFIGVIDTELLERVVFKSLKAKNIQHTNLMCNAASFRCLALVSIQISINGRNKPLKNICIERLGQRMATLLCVSLIEPS